MIHLKNIINKKNLINNKIFYVDNLIISKKKNQKNQQKLLDLN